MIDRTGGALGRLRLLCAVALLAFVAGCGTPYATIRTQAGYDLMLLGYDPVAYFTLGRPTRGDPALAVKLPGRTYYFANIEHADRVWPEIADQGWRWVTLKGWTARVPWYRTHASLLAEFREKHPGKTLSYDPGGPLRNLILEEPGWRAR